MHHLTRLSVHRPHSLLTVGRRLHPVLPNLFGKYRVLFDRHCSLSGNCVTVHLKFAGFRRLLKVLDLFHISRSGYWYRVNWCEWYWTNGDGELVICRLER